MSLARDWCLVIGRLLFEQLSLGVARGREKGHTHNGRLPQKYAPYSKIIVTVRPGWGMVILSRGVLVPIADLPPLLQALISAMAMKLYEYRYQFLASRGE